MAGAAILLPEPLQRRVEAMHRDLLTPDGPGAVDFLSPPGEPALVPHDSVTWRVFRNQVTLFIGGVAAVLLELAEPRVRHGVWDHSDFQRDPMQRLKRTGLAAMVTVYGPGSAARSMIAHVNRLHAKIGGSTDGGLSYRADDPELLRWVQTTASFGFVEAYRRFGGAVRPSELDRYYAEAAPVAELYGALDPPRSEAERAAMFQHMQPKLEPSVAIGEFLNIMDNVPALPRAARPAQTLLIAAAVDILPNELSALLGLQDRRLPPWQRPLVQAMGTAGSRLLLRSSPFP